MTEQTAAPSEADRETAFRIVRDWYVGPEAEFPRELVALVSGALAAKSNAQALAAKEVEVIQAIQDCDKCDLCEDHHVAKGK